jgi:hypothetical protein
MHAGTNWKQPLAKLKYIKDQATTSTDMMACNLTFNDTTLHGLEVRIGSKSCLK